MIKTESRGLRHRSGCGRGSEGCVFCVFRFAGSMVYGENFFPYVGCIYISISLFSMVQRLTHADPLTDAKGIGPYLEGRLRRALGVVGRSLTVGDLVYGLRNHTTDQVLRVLHRALQNARCNQCASPGPVGGAAPASYHVGDINQHGYAACVNILNAARALPGVGGVARYGVLPANLPRRSPASRRCGCIGPNDVCDGDCVRTPSGLCVPRAAAARGFVGSPPRPGQRTSARNEADRARMLRSARVRRDQSLARDPDSNADSGAGHATGPRYERRAAGSPTYWRTPGPIIRMPVVRR